jgi:hypothetical protein
MRAATILPQPPFLPLRIGWRTRFSNQIVELGTNRAPKPSLLLFAFVPSFLLILSASMQRKHIPIPLVKFHENRTEFLDGYSSAALTGFDDRHIAPAAYHHATALASLNSSLRAKISNDLLTDPEDGFSGATR